MQHTLATGQAFADAIFPELWEDPAGQPWLSNTLARGLEQTADYADRAGANEAHLVIFDRDPSLAWDDKVWRRSEFFGKRVILVWGC
ncbi:MAG: hypothetical protein WAT36_00095 [Chromatiaceae bacterium]